MIAVALPALRDELQQAFEDGVADAVAAGELDPPAETHDQEEAA